MRKRPNLHKAYDRAPYRDVALLTGPGRIYGVVAGRASCRASGRQAIKKGPRGTGDAVRGLDNAGQTGALARQALDQIRVPVHSSWACMCTGAIEQVAVDIDVTVPAGTISKHTQAAWT
jgi:hypothetical protein